MRQLGKDREELTSKPDQLQTLIKEVVGKQEVKEEEVVERVGKRRRKELRRFW